MLICAVNDAEFTDTMSQEVQMHLEQQPIVHQTRRLSKERDPHTPTDRPYKTQSPL